MIPLVLMAPLEDYTRQPLGLFFLRIMNARNCRDRAANYLLCGNIKAITLSLPARVTVAGKAKPLPLKTPQLPLPHTPMGMFAVTPLPLLQMVIIIPVLPTLLPFPLYVITKSTMSNRTITPPTTPLPPQPPEHKSSKTALNPGHDVTP